MRLLQRLFRVGGIRVADMQRHTGRLDLDGDAGVFGGDRAQRVPDLAEQRFGRIVDRVHEAGVELRPVAADQMNLGGHPRQRRKVAQRATRDQRRRGRRQRRKRTKGRR
jgi:hypothetical protein